MKNILALLLAGASLLPAQAPPAPVTQVMATLTVNAGAVREQMQKVMPGEVRATVQMYLDGKIQQWYSRGDGKGVIFILNCSSVAEAKALTDTLPLVKGQFAQFEFMPLSPLTPLRVLMQ